MSIRLILVAAVVIQAVRGDRYLTCLRGMQAISITCDTEEKMSFVLQYQNQKGFDFMKISRFPQNTAEVLVRRSKVADFRRMLDSQRINYQIFIRDLEKVVEVEFEQQLQFEDKTSRLSNRSFSFNHFPRYRTINNYLTSLTERNRDISLIEIGMSFEKRKINAVKFSSGGRNNPSIVIDAGIHGREWLAPIIALYTIRLLLMPKNKFLYRNIDWYIIPLLNPDGYEFSHTKNRLWRKTRSKMRGSLCRGVDGNRNFEYKWMEVGASNEPCHPLYAGSKPFSEIETQSFRDFIYSLNKNIKIYLSLHSYGQYLLHPWGYSEKNPPNKAVLRKAGQEAADAISQYHGTKYTVGSSSVLLYPAAGGSDDWMMAVGGAELAYTVELPGTSFIINSTEIQPVGEEIFEALKVFAKYAEVGTKYMDDY